MLLGLNELEIEKNIFYNNSAYESGGAIMLANKIPKNIMENIFVMNKAQLYYGNDYASDPYRILFENTNSIYL